MGKTMHGGKSSRFDKQDYLINLEAIGKHLDLSTNGLRAYTKITSGALARMLIFQCYAYLPDVGTLIRTLEKPSEAYNNLVYIDPVREPSSISKHIEPNQSVFILPASDYTSDDYQRLQNRPAEILIDVIPVPSSSGNKQGNDFSLHNFSLLLTPSTYARCAQSTHKRGYGGKCKLILKVGKEGSTVRQPVTVSY